MKSVDAFALREDKPMGFRRLVASNAPKDVIAVEAVETLMDGLEERLTDLIDSRIKATRAPHW
jgi:carbamate kinase